MKHKSGIRVPRLRKIVLQLPRPFLDILQYGLFIFIQLLFITSLCLHPRSAENSLIFVSSLGSSSLEPGTHGDAYSEEANSNVFEGLLTFKADGLTIAPCLAVNWETKENGVKWIFHLRKNVKFHNGDPFNADAVLDTFKRRMRDPDNRYKNWDYLFPYLKDIRKINDSTVEITLSSPFAPFLAALTEPSAYIVAPASYKNKEFYPIGTGAFVFEKWEKGRLLLLKGNKNYWDGKVRLERLVFKVIPKAAAKVLQLKTGNAHVSRIISSREQEELLGKKEIRMLSIPSSRVHYLAFNTRKPPFDKAEVRRALAHLVNKNALVKMNFQEMALPAVTPVPPHIFGFNRDIEDYSYARGKARTARRKQGFFRFHDFDRKLAETI
ncbi:MAG: hypothetical protein GY765_14590, partial [bacterium]|nr:hypothetical protein [bacterium]